MAKWCAHFKAERVGTTDNERSGRPTIASTPENNAHVEATILENRRATVSELEHDLSLSHGAIVRIILELGFHKVSVQCVPRVLSEDLKVQRMACAVSFLQQYAILSHEFLERIVTGDEMWVHHHTLETKRASMEWKDPRSPQTKNSRWSNWLTN
jgi:hypothetical protein